MHKTNSPESQGNITVAWYILSLLAIVLDDHLRYWIFGEEKPRYKWR